MNQIFRYFGWCISLAFKSSFKWQYAGETFFTSRYLLAYYSYMYINQKRFIHKNDTIFLYFLYFFFPFRDMDPDPTGSGSTTLYFYIPGNLFC